MSAFHPDSGAPLHDELVTDGVRPPLNLLLTGHFPLLTVLLASHTVCHDFVIKKEAELLVWRGENRPSLRLFVLTLVLCAESVVSFVIKSPMNGVTSQPQSCWSETLRANELSFSLIVSSKFTS